MDSEQGAKANHGIRMLLLFRKFQKYSILRGVTIPKVGGDTVWANTNTAYEDLPDGLEKLADKLWGIHSNEYDDANLNKYG